MNRLIVALLSALDALLAAAGGIAIALAPLTLLWVVGLGGGADWSALWPASAVVWQLGHLVPVSVQLPETYLAMTGIDPSAATFVLSLAPLAFAAFTAVFAARSGRRAAAAGAPLTGAVTGAIVFTAVTAAVALTGAASIATVEMWQAILFPALVFAVPGIVGAVTGAWIHDIPPVSRLRDLAEGLPGTWALAPGLVVRGTAIAATGLVGVGGLVLAVAVIARGGEVVALFQAGNVDVVGAIVIALGQLAYLPTLLVWALGFAAGPGFAVGTGTAVSPSGTQLGVVPGIPVLGAVPETTSTWLLLLVLLPVGVGALTGWMLRSRLVSEVAGDESFGPRLAVLGGVAVLTASLTALAAACASGGIGPGRLAETGPEPGPVALAVGLEIALGAAILMLAPRRRSDTAAEARIQLTAAAPLPEMAGLSSQTRAFSWEVHDDAPPIRAWGASPPLQWTHADDAPPDADDHAAADVEGPAFVLADDAPAEDPAGDAPGEDAEGSAVEEASESPANTSEQPTEPIIGFERGSGGSPRTGGDPSTSVD